jgi:hypothetical protein
VKLSFIAYFQLESSKDWNGENRQWNGMERLQLGIGLLLELLSEPRGKRKKLIRNEHKFPKRNKERKEIIIKKLFTTTMLCKISSAFNDLKKSFKEETHLQLRMNSSELIYSLLI